MRKSKLSGLVVVLSFFVACQPVMADLPIHCIKAQVEGDWQFYLSAPTVPKSFQETSCGHSIPSTEGDAARHKPDATFKTSSLLGLRLDQFNQVYTQGKRVGTWTMVYDEGISLELEQGSFFVYFEYEKREGMSVSICSRTLVGWYRDNNNRFGCFYGRQLSAINRITPVSVGTEILGHAVTTLASPRLISFAQAANTVTTGYALFQNIMNSKSKMQGNQGQNGFIFLAETESDSESEAATEASSENEAEERSYTEVQNQEEQSGPPVQPSAPKKARSAAKPVAKLKPAKKTAGKGTKSKQLGPRKTSPKKMAAPKPKPKVKPAAKAIVSKVVHLPAVKAKAKILKPQSVPKKPITKKSTRGPKGKRLPPKGLVSRKGKLLNLKTQKKLKAAKGKSATLRSKRVSKPLPKFPAVSKLRKGEVLPWKDPKLKVHEPEYHVRGFWMNMNMHWTTKKGSDKSLAQVSSTVLKEADRGALLVKQINESDLGWKASNYAFLAGKSFKEINLLAGRPKHSDKLSLDSRLDLNPHAAADNQISFAESEFGNLPRELNLEHVLSKAREQVSCGNCYLLATIGMLEARLRLKQNKNLPLSVQYVNDCNYFSQGCNGGFAVEVLRFIRDFWVPPEQCKPFQALQGTCTTNCMFGQPSEVVTVDKPYYVGDFFGKTTERLLMEELLQNGPLVVNFEPSEEFVYYKTGIFRPPTQTVIQTFNGGIQWTKVDHSVLLYGWGEENGVKFWRIQNSWGPAWGENGSFRIVRGVNSLGIESMGEAAIPKVVPVLSKPLWASASIN